MIYPLKLEYALYLVGLALIFSHSWAFFKPEETKRWLQALPRDKALGVFFVTIAAAWFYWLVKSMDLGDFSTWRERVLYAIPVIWFLTWYFVDEFLAVRGLRMLVLLGAEPLLESAFLRPEISRLLLVTLVYVWIAFSLFWIGIPFTLRDQIAWLTRSPQRWRLATFGGLAYGVVLLVLPLFFAKSV